MDIIKSHLTQLLLKLIARFVLKHMTVQQLIALVMDADHTHTNLMSKRGHVYRGIREAEGADQPMHVTNLLVELGVNLVKRSR